MKLLNCIKKQPNIKYTKPKKIENISGDNIWNREDLASKINEIIDYLNR